MNKSKFPPISKELIEALEERFKGTLPTSDVTLDAFRVLQGEQMVVRFLRSQHDKQSEL